MSNHDPVPHLSQPPIDSSDSGDGSADIIATIALITLVVGAVSFWLNSFPH
jgi:hypothetical protein